MSGAARSTSQVAILIPAFGASDKLRVCLESLGRHVPSSCPIFVLDDGTPDNSIATCCQEQALQNLTYWRSDTNRGFVATCNWGWSHVAPQAFDILLLNSDTEVTEGFLEEMLRVLYLFEKHAVVMPRSNNATLASIPFGHRDILPDESFLIWQDMRKDLPSYQVLPTAVGFCMLIKALVLEQFGLFDEIYSPGYNEENDFVCRINRCGYSAVMANQAFVYHHESATFGSRRKALEAAHRKTLIERYPEYDRKISNYLESELDPVERFAILRLKHRPLVLFDLFHLPARFSGSSEFALNLLREIYTQTQGEWDLFVGVSDQARFFASELNGYQLFEDTLGSEISFDLAFKAAQILTWAEFKRMHKLSPRLAFVLQDSIAVRCDYLAYPERKTIVRKTVESADQVYTISDFSRTDFEAYFGVTLDSQTIHHGTNAGLYSSGNAAGEYVLLVGNNFAHKGVKEALAYLTQVGPVRVLGGERPDESLPSQIQWLTSGNLTRGYVRELYARASVLVYPSYYEGYGLPIVEGIALGKPVVALDNELNRELAKSLEGHDLVLVPSFRHLPSAVNERLPAKARQPVTRPQTIRRWSDAAQEYVAGLRKLVAQPPNSQKMRARQDLVRVIDAAHHL